MLRQISSNACAGRKFVFARGRCCVCATENRTVEILRHTFCPKVFTKKLNRLNCWSTLMSNVTVGTGFRRAFIKQRFRATSCG